jgi:hypothetical protein
MRATSMPGFGSGLNPTSQSHLLRGLKLPVGLKSFTTAVVGELCWQGMFGGTLFVTWCVTKRVTVAENLAYAAGAESAVCDI